MIWIILIIGLILRLISLNQSIWLDEAINVLATQNFSFVGMITEYAKADFHPPLYFIIIWIWTKFFGIGEIAVRMPSVIFGIFTIYLVYLLAKRIHSKNLGLISSFLLAINPLHVYYTQEARMYALAALAVVLNFFIFSKSLKGDKVKLPYLIISNMLVLLSDYVALLVFPTQLFILSVYKKMEITKFWFKGFVLSLLLSVWWLPTFLSQLGVGAAISTHLPIWKTVVGGFDVKSIPLTLVKFIIGRINLDDKQLYYIFLLPICLVFLWLLSRGVTYIKNIEKKLLLSWLVGPVIMATLISFVIPIYSYFRLLFIIPAFVILVSLGLISYKEKLGYILLGLVVIIQLSSTCIYLFSDTFHRENWRGLVNYLKDENNNNLILFESSGTLPPFDYYAKQSLNAQGALKNFPAKEEDDIIDFDNTQGINNIFLIDYLVEISDPQRLVDKKLRGFGYELTETKDFNGVGFVYHYVKN